MLFTSQAGDVTLWLWRDNPQHKGASKMFTVHDPERPVFGKVVSPTLKNAISIKKDWEKCLGECRALITDSNGTVVTAKEIQTYLKRGF